MNNIRAKQESLSNWREEFDIDEAKVDDKHSPEGKEKERNKRKYGNWPVGQHAQTSVRRSIHWSNRGDKKRRGAKIDEAKEEQGRSDYGKASVRNKRKFGKEGEPAIFDTNSERGKMIDQRRAEHKARRGVKEDWKPEIEHSKLGDAKKKADKKRESKLPPHLQGDAIGKMKKAFSQEGYRVLASSDGQEKPSQFSYKDEKTAKKYVDSIKKGGGKATIVKEDIGSFKDYMANVEAAKKRQKDKEENRKRKSDAYIERVRKGIKFYDAKGSGRMVKGKKVYDKK